MKLLGLYVAISFAVVLVVAWRSSQRDQRISAIHIAKKYGPWTALAAALVWVFFLLNSIFTVKVF